MANRYLMPLYKQLFNEDFSYSDFSKRLKMQKAIYLLQEMGVPVGDYRFSWFKHGPYSQTLLDDMHNAPVSRQMDLSSLASDAEDSVEKLKHALIAPSDSKYSSEVWAECLGSIHYLKTNVFSHATDNQAVLKHLQKQKPHLNDAESNAEALCRIKNLFS